jgi:DNA polymerase-3 subunit gamma/tau
VPAPQARPPVAAREPVAAPFVAQRAATGGPLAGLPSVEARETALPAAAAASAMAAAAAPARVSTLAQGDRWAALVQGLCVQGSVQALTRELAMHAGLRAVDATASPPVWHLVVERETLRNPSLQDKLCAALAAQLGHALTLVLEPGVPDDSPARREAAERQRLQAEAEAAIHGDPVVQQLLSAFKTARIVPGSFKPARHPSPMTDEGSSP